MILALVLGIALVALAWLRFANHVFAGQRDRALALQRIRIRSPRRAPRTLWQRVDGVTRPLAQLALRLTRTPSMEAVEVRLLRAGWSRRMNAQSFLALQLIAGVLGVFLGATAGQGAGAFLLAIVFGALGLYLPHFAVSRAATRRTRKIESDLPHFLDQVSIAIEAGMSFDAALGYLLPTMNSPLADEMNIMVGEMRVGESRRNALRNVAERTGSADVGLLVNAIVNSDQLGTPLGSILRSQASDLRHRHQHRAEEQAQKAPVKMLFPIVIFILPVMFVVVLGPALINIHKFL